MVDVREAAELVHRTPGTVRRWARTHRVHAVKHGNKLLFRRDDLLRLGTGGESAGPSLSLADWAKLVRAAATGTPGGSSRDLVLEDRAARQEGSTGAGR